MLNRLYIVVGSLLILVLAAAFIVPHFIDWSDRRPQMEALASEALGTPVKIAGRIDFVLLPQPQLRFSKVTVGPSDAPAAEVAEVTADFSLMDFLRDRFSITHLSVKTPQIVLHIDKQGHFVSPIHVPTSVGASNVSIADAAISGGTVTLNDARTGDSWRIADIACTLTLAGLRGPFGLNGTGRYGDSLYQGRVTTSTVNADGKVQLTAFVRPENAAFSADIEGTLTSGERPSLDGKIAVKVAPPSAANGAQGVRGNLTLNSDLKVNADEILLPRYVLLPDENRAAMRLSGAVTVHLGADRRFDAVVSGGVMGLAPRDARDQSGTDRYELLRILDELHGVPVPPIAGRVGLDLAELDLRGAALRDVRLDATTDTKSWAVKTFTGTLAGSSKLSLSGTLDSDAGLPRFKGNVSLATDRLDALSRLWRKPDENTPLFNVPASLAASVRLADGHLELGAGVLDIDDAKASFDLSAGLADKSLGVTLGLGRFSPGQSRVLMALLPPLGVDGAFMSSFASGRFDLSADALQIDGFDGKTLAAAGTWRDGAVTVSKLSASDLGGVGFDLKGKVSGTLSAPQVSGGGKILVHTAADGGLLPALFAAGGVTPAWQAAIERLVPADLAVDLSTPDAAGAQTLDLSGVAGGIALTGKAGFTQGAGAVLTAPFTAQATFESDRPVQLAKALGIPVDLPSTGGAKLTASLDGTVSNSVAAKIALTTDADKMRFEGNLVVSDANALGGRGKLSFDLPVPEAWTAALGAGGLYLPPVQGTGEVRFDGTRSLNLSGLDFTAGGVPVSGQLSRTAQGALPTISGTLKVKTLDIGGLASLVGSGSALLHPAGQIWPDGPIAVGDGARTSRGRVGVSAERLMSGATELAGATGFDLSWDEKQVGVRSGTASLGTGKAQFDVSVCCAGVSAGQQLSGRLSLEKVPADRLMPDGSGRYVSGSVDGALQASGSGDSLAAIVGSLTGSGSFTVTGLKVKGMAPAAFQTVAATKNILDLDAADLAGIAGKALNAGSFSAPKMSGVISLAGGQLRASNLSATAETGHLFGGLGVDLSDLGLSGSWTLTPVGAVDAKGLIDANTALITSDLAGTLTVPERRLNLQTMADAIKVKALEVEVARLEKLKAEDEARKKAAADAAAKQSAEDAAKKAAAEQAAKQAEAQAQQDAPAAQATDPAAAASDTAVPEPAPKPADLDAVIRQLDQQLNTLVQQTDPNAVTPAPAPAPTPAQDTTDTPIDLMGG